MAKAKKSNNKKKSSTEIQKQATGPSVKGLCSSAGACQDGEDVLRPYRVFISYSHEDADLADKVEEHLWKEGLFPITDHEIRIGETFSEEIREMIECVHVFMPLVTPSANERLWVQQEIGYAAALNVPVCPIAVGDLPAGMTEQIQGIHIELDKNKDKNEDENEAEKEDKKDSWDSEKVMEVVEQRLTYRTIHDLVERARKRSRQGRYDYTMYWSEREELLVSLTKAARRESCRLLQRDGTDAQAPSADKKFDGDVWRVRQRTGFSSFTIPDAPTISPAWDVRDPHRYPTEEDRRLLRAERQAMSDYMKCFGCDLIIDPRVIPAGNLSENREADSPAGGVGEGGSKGSPEFKHSPLATAFRIRLLIDFIERHQEAEELRIVIPEYSGAIKTNLIIVGDWFACEAVVPRYGGRGYERTLFTRHAPTVLNMIERFDQDLRDCLPGREGGPDAVREAKEKVLAELLDWGATNEKKLSDEDRERLEEVSAELGLKGHK